MLEFEHKGQQYRAGKLNTFQQLHLSRKVAPLLPKLLPTIAELATRREEEMDAPIDLGSFASSIGPLTETLAEMSDADVEYIFGISLSAVSRLQGNNWVPIWNKGASAPMFEDLELPDQLQIVVKVVADNLGPFMRGLEGQMQQANSPQQQTQ